MLSIDFPKRFNELCSQLKGEPGYVAAGGFLGTAKAGKGDLSALGPVSSSTSDLIWSNKVQEEILAQYYKHPIIYVNYHVGLPNYGAFELKLRRKLFSAGQVYFFQPKSDLAENGALIWLVSNRRLNKMAEAMLQSFLDDYARDAEQEITSRAATAFFHLTRALLPKRTYLTSGISGTRRSSARSG